MTNQEWLADKIKTSSPEEVYFLLNHIIFTIGTRYNSTSAGIIAWLMEDYNRDLI